MIMTSVDNIMTLFDTLTHSGHINTMHMLGIVVEQIASFRRLPTKLDEEVKVEALHFQPAKHSLEDGMVGLELGRILADFGSGEMLVMGSDLGGQAVNVQPN